MTASSAALHGELNPEGSSTHFRFQYIPLSTYEENVASGRDGFSGARSAPANDVGLEAAIVPSPVSVALTPPSNSLLPDTGYRYRILATNQAGTTGEPVHVFRTQSAAPPAGLPDSRAWEMVSPLEKGGGSIARPEALFGGGDIQAAASGSALTYGSATSFGEALGAPPISQYLSRRGANGWASANLSPPLASGVYGDRPDGAPYRLFSGELGSGLLYGGDPCRGVQGCPSPAPPLPGSGAPGGYQDYYLRDLQTGAYLALLDASDLSHTSLSPEDFEVSLAGATADLSHVVLSSCAALTANARENPAPGGCSGQNLYEWSGGTLRALNLLPSESGTAPVQSTPGAVLAAPTGAISEDGNRVYVYQLEDGPLYLREGSTSKMVAAAGAQPVSFQAASRDGRYAFFTQGAHLHRWDAESTTSIDLTPSGGVSGVLAVSGDGSRVYYQDSEGLELWDQGTTTQIAAGQIAAPSDYPPSSATTRLSSDGMVLVFLSDAPLGGVDNTDAQTGQPDTEVYRYDALSGSLLCASCQPSGERPYGSSSIPGSLANGSTRVYRPRALSADGARLLFDSNDHLLGTDTDGSSDVYQWEAAGEGSCQIKPGCVSLISAGRNEGGEFLDASADGSNVFFITGDSLVRSDPGSLDVYDARIGGGFAEAQEPIACEGDSCQPLPSPPEDPTAGTSFLGPGNPPPKYFGHKKRRHHKHHRHRRKKKKHHARKRASRP